MKENEKIARQLLKLAKMMVAADGEFDSEFYKTYTYQDANPEFKTEIVSRGDSELSFSVVLTPSVKLDVKVGSFISGSDYVSATVVTRWNIEYNVYRNGGFQPETTPKETDIEAKSLEDMSNKVTQIVAECTNGLKVTR